MNSPLCEEKAPEVLYLGRRKSVSTLRYGRRSAHATTSFGTPKNVLLRALANGSPLDSLLLAI